MAEGIKSLRVERYKLDTATQGLLVHSAACYLLVRRTSSAGVEIGVQINDRDHPMVPLTDGEGWQHLAYNRLYLTWTAQPGQWIELAFQGTPSEEDLSKFQLFKRSDKSNVQVTNDSLAPVPVSAPSALPVTGSVTVSGGVTVTGNVATTQGEPTIPSGTAVQIYATNPNGSWTDAYTVPSGKSCLLESLWFASETNAGGQLRIIDGSSVTKYTIKTPAGSMGRVGPLCSGWRLPAGWKIQTYAAGYALLAGAGWEQ